ncbi:MAG TPA: DUF4270 family protein [Ferruginibacter sp.]|nr:DUF4270 family protein [Ferruginibacter sp.]
MFKRFLPITLLSYFSIVCINWGCTKLDTTTLGSDLIPAVDNVNTFADTLDITTTQGVFNDTFKIGKSENHLLGNISNDPIFGETQANLFFQPKPGFYPFYFGSAKDSIIAIDSVVLSLSYQGSWGDTSAVQQLTVRAITDNFFSDSVYKKPQTISYAPQLGDVLGTASIDIRTLKNSVKINHGKDSVTNQIRIKLSEDFKNLIATRDSNLNSINNAFRSDTAFKKFNKGFAVIGTNGNAVMYINLLDSKTRLEVFLRKKSNATGKIDSVYNSFTMLSASSNIAYITPSASSNFVMRSHPSYISNPVPGSSAIYLQSGPGTFAKLKIPGLDTFKNAIVHRAQISIEQIPENPVYDSIFSVPSFMYLDIIDTTTVGPKWKPLYFDLNPRTTYDPDFKTGFPYFPSSGEIDYSYFGGYARKKTNALGDKVWYYDLNVTRHVQQIITKKTINYELRLFPGFTTVYPQYGTALNPASIIPLSNPLAFGRIKVKSGSYPDPEKKVKMRMIIIYSKL